MVIATRRLLVAAVMVGLAALPVVVRAASLAAIIDAPASYAGQEVTVVGTVTDQRLGYAGESVYTISGEDRRITVFSRSVPPTTGDRLEVTAQVGWREPDEEFTWPPILLERDRHPAP